MKSRIGKFLFLLAIATVALTGINAKKTNYLLITENEPALEIEHWMTDEFFWTGEFIDVALATDKDLAIDPWMYNDDYWK